MRAILTVLLIALLVLGIWSFMDARTFLMGPSLDGYDWWWPREISTFGQRIDFIFWLITVMIVIFFVLTFVLLIAAVWRFSAPDDTKGVYSHGNHKMELLWTAVPAGCLVIIALSQMNVWYDVKFRKAIAQEEIFAEVFAEQFAWRMRYPGPDGRFGTYDDIENSSELVVPVDEKIVFHLRSRDVLHSFFVPKLRVKQDAVPGMTIPVWFQVDEEEFREAVLVDQEPGTRTFETSDGEQALELTTDLICAELCGWGHYKMAGKIRILSPKAYAEWMEAKVAEKFSNGQE